MFEVWRTVTDWDLTGFKVNSDWRCPVGNAAVGGTTGSQHVVGLAGDVTVDGFNAAAARDFRDAAIMAGAGWFKEYNSYVHIDWGPVRGNW